MGKWVGRLFYVIIVIFMTFFIAQSANTTRNNAYLTENMLGYSNDEPKFFKGINTLLNLDYMTNEPIIPAYTDNTGEHQLEFKLYGIGYTDQEGNHLDGLMIFINHVKIYEKDETTGFLELVQNPYIRLTIYTDEPIPGSTDTVSYSGFEGQGFSAGFIFDQESTEIAYDFTYYVDGNGAYVSSNSADATADDVPMLAHITRVDVDYSNGASNGGDLVYATESIMIVSNQPVDDPVFSDSLKITDFSYDPADYRLSGDITAYPITDAQAAELNLFTARDDLSAYNWEMIRVYLLYAAFVFIITYLIFFHKNTMAFIHSRRAAKKKNKNDDPNVVEAKPVEQIFKDDKPENQDGK